MDKTKVVINGTTLDDIKELLYTGQRMAITTGTFEKIIELLEEKIQECKNLKKKLDVQTITASRRYSELNTAWNNRCKKYNNDLKQLVRCQKTLEEIEKFFEYKCNLCREEYDLLPCDNCINKQILGIINKTNEREQ